MTPRRFALAAGVGCLLVLVFAPACRAQKSSKYDKNRKVKVEYLAELHGVAFCRDNGSFAMVRTGLSAIDMADVIAHEQKHLEQYTRFADCKAFYAWYDTPKGMLAAEAEAYRAGWCVSGRLGADTVSLRSLYLQILVNRYVPGTAIYEASQEFNKYGACPK